MLNFQIDCLQLKNPDFFRLAIDWNLLNSIWNCSVTELPSQHQINLNFANPERSFVRIFWSKLLQCKRLQQYDWQQNLFILSFSKKRFVTKTIYWKGVCPLKGLLSKETNTVESTAFIRWRFKKNRRGKVCKNSTLVKVSALFYWTKILDWKFVTKRMHTFKYF